MATMPGGTEPAIALAVRDNGIGIPLDLQQKLFTGFSQADMSTTRRYGGMGIGLALAARIMAAHRGKITFKSEEGNGSLFALWVPTRQPATYPSPDLWQPERVLASVR
jgi:signal transduction histidine kinase